MTSYMPPVYGVWMPEVSRNITGEHIALMQSQHARAEGIPTDQVCVDYYTTGYNERILRFRAPNPSGSYYDYKNIQLYRVF